jgi:thiosulfate dehydrogenase
LDSGCLLIHGQDTPTRTQPPKVAGISEEFRMRFRNAWARLLFICLALCVAAPVRPALAANLLRHWNVPDISRLPDDAWGRTVRLGARLVTNTASLIGPEVKDPKQRFSGNNLNCESCHLEAGTKEFGLPFQGVYASFPSYRARSGSVGTIEDRIQGCMVRSMNGKPLPPAGPEMTALVAYLKFLSVGHVVGAETPGRGAGAMAELKRAANPSRGRAIYGATCASCHGAQGAGKRNGQAGDAKGYAVPPLWGAGSFNDGAGMGRLIDAANFIHSNMPFGTSWKQPALSPDDAWDVAAFLVSQPRPHKSGQERDFPNRLEKPADAPYGPYADNIPAQQHKYGPFKPIRDAISKLKKKDSSR